MERGAAKGIKAFIFDFDGTLAQQTLDFKLMRREAVAALARFVSVPDRPELPTMELLDIVGEATEAARTARCAALEAVRRVESEAAKQSSLFPYVRPMLAALHAQGLVMAIITRNCPEAVRTVFPDIDAHSLLFTRDDVARVKPHPDHLLAAVDALGIEPEQALMIGDHPMDVMVGKRAGTFTAAVATGEHPLEALRTCEPDFLARNGNELMRRLGVF